MSEPNEHPSFLGELLDLYVGNWADQALVYLITFALGGGVGLVAEFRYHLPPDKLAPLVVGFTSLLVLVVPAAYVAIHRLRSTSPSPTVARPVASQAEPWAGTMGRLVSIYLNKVNAGDIDLAEASLALRVLTKERPTPLVSTRLENLRTVSAEPVIKVISEKGDIFLSLSRNFDFTKEWLLASQNLSAKKGVELRKELEQSFAFSFWYIIYSLNIQEDTPTVSFEEAVKTYAEAIEKAQK